MNLFLLGFYCGLSQNVQLQKPDDNSQSMFNFLHSFYLMKKFKPDYTISNFAQDVSALNTALEKANKDIPK
jgi:hypothetical protein